MTDALAHRGPDGIGTHQQAGVVLGHRRLSIIDLAGGAQPIFNEDRSIAVVFNGEIYNYIELQKELTARGHRLRTRADTEVIVHLYEERGDACVDALNGMFAFALWDAHRRRLLLARDRLGEKPLFYAPHADGLAFASELKALRALPWLPREINGPALDDYLAYGYVPAERCIIDGVQKLPPGSRLVWQDGRTQVSRYWRPALSAEPLDADEPDILDEFEQRLRDAVRLRLRSDVPLGVFLSGGIDSSAISALAQQEAGRPIRTFTIGFENAGFSEAPHALQLAEALGTDHSELIVSPQDLDDLDQLVWHLDEPLADPSALPTAQLCRMAREHVTVCLSGDGGDELLAGYRRYPQALRHERLDGAGFRLLRNPLAYLSRQIPRHWPGAGFLERAASDGADRYFAQCCFFHAEQRGALLRPGWRSALQRRPWLFEANNHHAPELPLVSQLQELDQRTYLPDDILVKVDRMSMMHGLEVRVPLLDHTLVEFVNRLPLEWKYRGDVSKYLLRRLLRRHVPAEVLERPKRGFGIPTRQWFRGDLEARAREHLTASDAALAEFLEPAAVNAVLADHQRGGRDRSRQVWALLILETWLRSFRAAPRRTPAPPARPPTIAGSSGGMS